VIVEVSPALREEESEVMAMVGGSVSTLRVRELSASFSSWLLLEKESENLSLAT